MGKGWDAVNPNDAHNILLIVTQTKRDSPIKYLYSPARKMLPVDLPLLSMPTVVPQPYHGHLSSCFGSELVLYRAEFLKHFCDACARAF